MGVKGVLNVDLNDVSKTTNQLTLLELQADLVGVCVNTYLLSDAFGIVREKQLCILCF